MMSKFFCFKTTDCAKEVIEQIKTRVENQNLNDNLWYLVDKELYELCQKYPYHKNTQEVMAKICMIGRVYSAQIERRKNAEDTKGDFYGKYVVPTLINSEIDDKIAQLKKYNYPNINNVEEILSVHKYLQDLFKEESTNMSNRSLVSKYLHFHCPNLFFIYDSYSNKAINHIIKTKKGMNYTDSDDAYAKYFCKSLYLQEIIAPTEKNFPKILDSFLQEKYFEWF